MRVKRQHLDDRAAFPDAVGDPDNGVPAGTPWEKVPDTWTCPECGAGKDQFSKQ